MSQEITGSCQWDVSSHIPAFTWANWRLPWQRILAIISFGYLAFQLIISEANAVTRVVLSLLVLSSIVVDIIRKKFWKKADYIRSLQKTPGYGHTATWTINEEGRKEHLDGKDVFIPWLDVRESRETPDGILLFVDDGIFSWLPKKAFTDSDYTRLIKLIAAKTKHSKIG